MRGAIAGFLLGIAWLLPVAAAGSERGMILLRGARQAELAAACADPASRACGEALRKAAVSAAAALVELAQHRHPKAAALAAAAADSGLPELRVAAAEALALLSVEAPNDAVLAELLDDPVPAVRTAARTALAGSSSETARQLGQRADRFARGNGQDLGAQAGPNPASLGVPLPADALFLYFASDPERGRYAFVTGESPAKVAARLPKAARGPIAPADFRAAIEPETQAEEEEPAEPAESSDSQMPSSAELQAAMAMAAKMMGAVNAHPGASPEEQAALMAKATGLVQIDAGLGETYADAEAFGDAQLYVIEMANGLDAVVAVYRDVALGRTGIGVHLKR